MCLKLSSIGCYSLHNEIISFKALEKFIFVKRSKLKWTRVNNFRIKSRQHNTFFAIKETFKYHSDWYCLIIVLFSNLSRYVIVFILSFSTTQCTNTGLIKPGILFLDANFARINFAKVPLSNTIIKSIPIGSH